MPLQPTSPILSVNCVGKSFTMHLRGGIRLPVVAEVSFDLAAGECAVLGGPSGIGKSSILRMIYGNYAADSGRILISDPSSGRTEDLAVGDPRTILRLRRDVIGYVGQFLRAVPRVAAIDVVAEPLISRGASRDEARERAAGLLAMLNIPQALFELPPATFSGGEKQRVNIARGFAVAHPLLLLDEPTASLDAANREIVCDLIEARKAAGTAILGIFHDEVVRERVATRIVDVTAFSARQAA
jgi:alpha-D-ribose 1-methylphosphonate 5-triphosphate synthase subunit PhnL